MVFQAHLTERRRTYPAVNPVAGTLVEIEHYHPAPPKTIPADEYCTHRQDRPQRRRHRTPTDPGWWCPAAAADAGMKDHDGKSYPVRQRSIFWVQVDEKIADK